MAELRNQLENFTGIFQSFNIEDKIQELEEMLIAQNLDLQHKGVVIAVPAIDESHRLIYSDDRVLFDTQEKDACTLAQHIMRTKDADVVRVVTDSSKIGQVATYVAEPFECVIFLHEFMEIEKTTILETLRDHYPDLQHFELY